MPQLQLIGGPQSNFVWTTRITATHKGVSYTLTEVMPHAPEASAVHPLGKIPAMRHGELALGESRAICQYIDRTFDGPSLIPSDPVAAAITEQWVSIVMTHVDPILMRQYAGAYYFPRTVDGNPDRTRIDPLLSALEPQFAMLEKAVSATGYLAGTSFTLADAYLMPILFYMDNLPESSQLLAQATHLKSYFQRHLQRGSIAATIPPPFPGREFRIAS